MKKRIAVLICVCCSMAVLTVMFVLSCSTSSIDKNYAHISDYRYAVLRAQTDNFRLDIISGVRETPYERDGKCAEDKTEYTVLTFTPSSDFDGSTLNAHIEVKGTGYDLTPVRHPFKGSYSAEIAAALPEGTEEIGLTVCGETVTATSPVKEGISGDKALAIALGEIDAGKDGEYEIYLRLSENTVTAAGGWYWYVAVVRAEGTRSVLISASSGEIVAVRDDRG